VSRTLAPLSKVVVEVTKAGAILKTVVNRIGEGAGVESIQYNRQSTKIILCDQSRWGPKVRKAKFCAAKLPWWRLVMGPTLLLQLSVCDV
jgi:hypothetical protein